MKLKSRRRSVSTTFNVISSMLLVLLLLALAYNNYRKAQALILKGATDNARAIAQQIIVTRDYLARSVTTEPEKNYNLVPQVAATKIAQRLTQGSSFSVRQISLRYRNPENRPDAFEATQLGSFKSHRPTEFWHMVTENGKQNFRYLLPMVADKSCLTCHGSYESAPGFVRARFPKGHFSYGYKVGEVIGAISISIPMEGLYREIGANLRHDILYDGFVLIIFLVITGWVIRKVILTPVKTVATHISDVAKTGNFSERMEQTTVDEIGELVGSFNELMAELDRKTMQRIESEDRYRNFIEIAQSPIITFMADGKIVISNQKAEKLFGLSKQELLGQSIYDFMEKGHELHQAVEDYFSTGRSDLIGTTTQQKMRDICGRILDVEMIISVSQSDQNQMFTAILRSVKTSTS